MKNEIILPKKHLSWSQMSLWKSSKKAYMNQYFGNGKRLDSRYLQFGKGVAECIEDGTYKDKIPDLFVHEHVEYEIRVEIEGVPLLCYLDSYDSFLNIFSEIKTGKRDKDGKAPWNDAEVQKHGQLLFYAVALRKQTGQMPWFCDLHWLETREHVPQTGFFQSQDRGLLLTGVKQDFRRYFDVRELDRFEKEIVATATEISEAYKKWVSDL